MKRTATLFAYLTAAAVWVPILTLVVAALVDGNNSLGKILLNDEVVRGTKNSVIVAIAVSSISTAVGGAAVAILLSTRPDLRRSMLLVSVLGLLVPDLAVGLAWANLLQTHAHGLVRIIVAQTTVGMSYVIFLSLLSVTSARAEMLQVARQLAERRLIIARQVVWPSIRWPLVLAGTVVFLLSLDDYVIAFTTGSAGSMTLPTVIGAIVRRRGAMSGVDYAIPLLSLSAVVISVAWTLKTRRSDDA